MKQAILSLTAALVAITAGAAQPTDSVNGQYYKLFAPLTFYHSVAAGQLSLEETTDDDTAEAIDQTLMNV